MIYIVLVVFHDGERHFQWFNDWHNAKSWLDMNQDNIISGSIISTTDTKNVINFF